MSDKIIKALDMMKDHVEECYTEGQMSAAEGRNFDERQTIADVVTVILNDSRELGCDPERVLKDVIMKLHIYHIPKWEDEELNTITKRLMS